MRASGAGPLRQALFSAITWGFGFACGVAVGGWLTVISGAGAPGVEALNLVDDVLLLPGIAGGGVFALVMAIHGVRHLFRRRGSAPHHPHETDANDPHRDGDQVIR
ncbi:MAG: hypothetical protein M1617_03255 [Actinobacteria bacterium]|nr:hypothetical protein [Actinomycetota bacterium]MCL5887306.1 hypothetical protein [Actinomycetota bacterium]